MKIPTGAPPIHNDTTGGMKNPRRWPSILVFVTIQVAWVTMVTLWIIWYIRGHYALIQRMGAWDVFIIIEGAVLLSLIVAGSYILFILYQRQLTLMKTQMYLISSITHEFKTPLATMQLYLETMLMRELPRETKEQFLKGMLSENQRLKSMVEKFLESARLGYQRRPYILKPMSVEDFITRFIERHATLLEGVDIHTAVTEDIHLAIDMDAFDMVFSNLAENAVHYSDERPQIEIRVWKDKKKAFIEFSDQGIGIPQDRSKDVFKMFQRLPEAVAMRASGTGMGLYVTREIVRAHGGKIRVNREIEGQGASFLITLPLAKVNHER